MFTVGLFGRCYGGKGTSAQSLKSSAASSRFSSKIALYFAPSILLSAMTSFPVPAKENLSQSMILQPPCFTIVFNDLCVSLSCDSSDQSTFSPCLLCPLNGLLQTAIRTSYGFISTMVCVLALFHKGQISSFYD
ncbi:hypothetical protein ATANTOWER_022131 [Ataeniobius toweri]|uniref:Uncharacterized protein n=1 Tax=Ataeniobius toweri TaxID=208326 RepID=A0ABU7A287_9TELE|nr:hypothetical protein [Ataeniobius toweri]